MRSMIISILSRLVIYLQIVILCQLITITAAIASEEIKLATETIRALNQKGKPYIDCVFKKMERSYHVISVPWARAQQGSIRGKYDGFFMASKNDTRDQYAVRSEPILNIEWLYVVRKNSGLNPDSPDFINKSFGANFGSARLAWLLGKFEKEELTGEITATPDSKATLNMLSRGRIDVNLENSENLRTAFNSTGLNPSEFLTFIAKEKSVGVYFTYTFLKREPGFLGKFNTTLQECKNN